MPNKIDDPQQGSTMQTTISDEQFISILREHGTDIEAWPAALLVEGKTYLQNNERGENLIKTIQSEENELDMRLRNLVKQLPPHDFSSLERKILSQSLPEKRGNLTWVDTMNDWLFGNEKMPHAQLLRPSIAAFFSMTLGIVSGSLYSLNNLEQELSSQNIEDELYLIALTSEIKLDNLNITELEGPE